MEVKRLQRFSLCVWKGGGSAWWMMLFCGLSLLCAARSWHVRRIEICDLEFRVREMEKVKVVLEGEREDLETCIASQSDPAWIEMVLMRELGVVPEGWMKIHFQ